MSEAEKSLLRLLPSAVQDSCKGDSEIASRNDAQAYLACAVPGMDPERSGVSYLLFWDRDGLNKRHGEDVKLARAAFESNPQNGSCTATAAEPPRIGPQSGRDAAGSVLCGRYSPDSAFYFVRWTQPASLVYGSASVEVAEGGDPVEGYGELLRKWRCCLRAGSA
jgi:hypothetical protein